jgi:N-acyl-D-aspartate/D-glutamate deacylase
VQALMASTAGERPGFPPEQASFGDEVAMFGRLSRGAAVPVVFTLTQNVYKPHEFRDILRLTADENARGAHLAPMVASRAVTALTSLTTYHMFMTRPTYRRLRALPFDDMVAALRRPEVKAAILAEPDEGIEPAGSMDNLLSRLFRIALDRIYPLEEPLDYEPTPDRSLGALAAAAGRDPIEDYYDFLLGDDGRAVAACMMANYSDGNLDACREMIVHPHTVLGLSDAGAHVDFLCDASLPTFQLVHWARGRTRGPGAPIETIVRKSTADIARLYGLHDRGSIEAGMRADLNVIDHEHLAVARPALHRDLPAGGARFLQPAAGYVATFVRGEQTRADDADTGARPGRVARRATRKFP